MRSSFIVPVVGMVVGLVLLGWRVSAATDALDDVKRATGANVSSAISKAEQASAFARVQQGVVVAEVIIAQEGSPASLTTEALHAFEPTLDPSVVVALAGGGGYCIEAAYGSTVAHASSPGFPELGPCS
jgi:hypothetical protein